MPSSRPMALQQCQSLRLASEGQRAGVEADGSSWSTRMPIPVFLNESSLPRVIGGLAIEGVDIYPDERLGIKVRYGIGPGLKADVYLYNLGRSDITVDLRSPDVLSWFEGACQDIQRLADMGMYVDLDIRGMEFLYIPADAADPFCLWAGFAYRQATSPLDSHLLMRVSHLAVRTDRGYINKVRFTHLEGSNEEEVGFDRFLAFLVEWTTTVQDFAPRIRAGRNELARWN